MKNDQFYNYFRKTRNFTNFTDRNVFLKMADFDEIYEEEDEDEHFIEDSFTISVPDPIVIRAAGNVTMYVMINVSTPQSCQ